MYEDIADRYALLLKRLAPDLAGLHELGMVLRDEFGCERTTLYLKAARGVYVSIYAEGLEDMTLSVKPGEGLVGKAVQRRCPLLSNDADYDPDSLSRLRDHYSGYVTRSLLVAPIPGTFVASRGAVQLVNKRDDEFTEQDADRLCAAAQGLRKLHRLCTRPDGNLWDPHLHREGRHDGPSAQA
jgi:hypothetical protein